MLRVLGVAFFFFKKYARICVAGILANGIMTVGQSMRADLVSGRAHKICNIWKNNRCQTDRSASVTELCACF